MPRILARTPGVLSLSTRRRDATIVHLQDLPLAWQSVPATQLLASLCRCKYSTGTCAERKSGVPIQGSSPKRATAGAILIRQAHSGGNEERWGVVRRLDAMVVNVLPQGSKARLCAA